MYTYIYIYIYTYQKYLHFEFLGGGFFLFCPCWFYANGLIFQSTRWWQLQTIRYWFKSGTITVPAGTKQGSNGEKAAGRKVGFTLSIKHQINESRIILLLTLTHFIIKVSLLEGKTNIVAGVRKHYDCRKASEKSLNGKEKVLYISQVYVYQEVLRTEHVPNFPQNGNQFQVLLSWWLKCASDFRTVPSQKSKEAA
jgi:hypothetical protein